MADQKTDPITDETLEYVAILAKLELSQDEKKAAKQDMERMLCAECRDRRGGCRSSYTGW